MRTLTCLILVTALTACNAGTDAPTTTQPPTESAQRAPAEPERLPQHEAGLREMIRHTQAMTGILRGVTDRASAEEALEHVERIHRQATETRVRLEKLTPPSEEQFAYFEPIFNEAEIAEQAFFPEYSRIMANPEFSILGFHLAKFREAMTL